MKPSHDRQSRYLLWCVPPGDTHNQSHDPEFELDQSMRLHQVLSLKTNQGEPLCIIDVTYGGAMGNPVPAPHILEQDVFIPHGE
jgi:hypothetical protein